MTESAGSGPRISPGVIAQLSVKVSNAEGEEVPFAQERSEWVIGYGQLLPAVDQALLGHAVGDTVMVELGIDDAYGRRDKAAVIEVERSEFPADVRAGDCFAAEDESGQELNLLVLDVSEDRVVLDRNHPLAGLALRAEVRICSTRFGSEAELQQAEDMLQQLQAPLDLSAGQPVISPQRLLRGSQRGYEKGAMAPLSGALEEDKRK